MRKKIVAGIVLLLVLFTVGFCAFGPSLDSLVKTAIEKVGSDATRTKVTLGGVKISASSGEASLRDLLIKNPEGFSADAAFKLGLAAVKLDRKSLIGSGPVVIDSLVIEEPELTYEVDMKGNNNLQTLQRNVMAYGNGLAGGAGADAPKEKGESKKDEESRKIIIQDLSVKGGKVSLKHAALKDQALTAQLPAIHMTKIGEQSGGLSQAALASLLFNQISTAAVDAGSTELSKFLKNQAVESVKGAIDQSKIGKSVGKALGGILGK